MLRKKQTQFLEKQEGKIAFYDGGGKGHPIICAPGMGDIRQVYRHVTPLLQGAGFRVINMDLRGLGESSVGWDDYSDEAIANDYLEMVEKIGRGPAYLVGNSKTASSVVIASVKDPEKVKGIVLIGPFAREAPTTWTQNMMFKLAMGGPWGKKAWLNYYEKKLYPEKKPRDLEKYVAKLSDNLSEDGRFTAFRKQAHDKHEKSESLLHQVNVPVLIIMGTVDPDFPQPINEAKELGKMLNARVIFSEGSGHYPQADNPKLVAEAIAMNFKSK